MCFQGCLPFTVCLQGCVPVLELGEQDASLVPSLGLPTAAQRVAAAGADSDVVLAAMFAAVHSAHGDAQMAE